MLPPLIAGQGPRLLRGHRAQHRPRTRRRSRRRPRSAAARYVVSGQKVWISTAQVAEKMLLLRADATKAGLDALLHRLRPQPHRGARDRQDGPQRGRLEPGVLRRAAGAGGRPHRRGGQGLRVHPARHEPRAHPDRRRARRPRALRGEARAPHYAKERIVFDRPIGQNQGIQHPLAANWMALEAANLMVFKAASALRPGQALRRRGERRQVPRRRSLLRRLPAGGDDARRLRLRARNTTSSAICANRSSGASRRSARS